MRNIQFITFCLVLLGCNSVERQDNGEDKSQVKEWLTFEGKADMPNIVLVSGDEEYRSEEALPQLAKILSSRHGFNCTVLFAQDVDKPGIVNPNNVNNIPGLEALKTADMMVIFTRFRALPDDQMQHIDDFLKSGKPVLGIRTATHAFKFKDSDIVSKYEHYGNYYQGDDEWNDGFGRSILGEKWISHQGDHRHQSTTGLVAPGAENHPVLNGIEDRDIWGPTDVYGVRLPLPGDSQLIVLGQVTIRAGEYDGNDPLYGMRETDTEVAGIEMGEDEDDTPIEINRNDPMMPVVWTKSYQLEGGKKGKAIATTIGAATDMLSEGTRRMLVNGIFWSLGLEVPKKANVDLVGTFNPSSFASHEDEYWLKKNLSISSLE